ncbi:sugar kinase [Puniceibacterium sp. IMCC21224]|uniref:sugar kinase n=1 Tax=Puniceibacterium sp. IMCC21224 TaxID=1618204 RepID=UPI00064DF0F6|nr:sugar kinase [Puniceibacterium sp. IMCC21224]KMK66420.1 sugar kinase, ribokinase [Puniceibacterium sp. IMCC21224]
MKLVFAGECMVELAPDGACYTKGFAGDTFNMAWYARKICPAAWSVGYVSAIGSDAVSDELAAFMSDAGVDISHVQRHADRTVGLYMISLKDGERSFSYWRSHSAARQMAADGATLDSAFAGADVVCISGITIAVLDGDGRATLAAALTRYRADGGQVAFDPNIRPRLWADAPSMCASVMTFAALSDIVLASFEDEATHFGDADPAATLQRYQDAGVGCVVVKDGGNPILGARGDEQVCVAPEPVAMVVDSTAAGDSFNAGFLVSMLSGADLATALIGGASLSRQVIQQRGALSQDAVRFCGGAT